jgi:hypothetical protein
MRIGVANDMLSLDLVAPPARERVRDALVRASRDVVDGGPDRLEDLPADSQEVFIGATSKLLRLLTASANGTP